MALIVADSEAQANTDKNIQKNRYPTRRAVFYCKITKTW